jgi:hypothetical protein
MGVTGRCEPWDVSSNEVNVFQVYLFPQQGRDSQGVRLATLILRFIHSENGTTSIEYALIASLIFLAIVLSVT